MKIYYLGALMLLLSFSFNLQAQSSGEDVSTQLRQLQEENQLTRQEAQWVVTSEHVSSVSGVRHVYFTQTYNGIEINGTQSSIHVMPNNEILKSNLKFVGGLSEKTRGVSQPSITSSQAVQNAANQLGYNVSGNLSIIENRGTANKAVLLSEAGISLSPIPVKLMYQLNEDGTLSLAWDLSIEEVAQNNWWSVRVDAVSGQIISKDNWMLSCTFEHDHSIHEKKEVKEEVLDFNKNLYDIPNYAEKMACAEENSLGGVYEVFEMPIESPYFGPRTNVTGEELLSASPFGWHDTNGSPGAEFTTTRGNNVNAYEDGDNPGFQPDGGPSLNFTGYPFSQNYTPANQFE